MSAAVALGLDVGTQGVRAIAVDEHGTVLAEGEHGWALHRGQDGIHEQIPAHWWTAVLTVLSGINATLSAAESVRIVGLAVTSTSGTLVLTDRAGQPIRPAIMWDDTRAAAQAEHMESALAPFTARTGLRVRPSFPMAKLEWLREHDPQTIARTAHVLHESDWLLWQLGVDLAVTDPTNALKTGYDIVRRDWDVGIAEQWLSLLPEVVPAGTVVGALNSDVAAQTGLPVGVPLVTAMTDANTATLAAGVVRPGDWSSTLGTGLSIKGVSESLLRDGMGAVYSHAHPDGGWLVSGTSHCGAGAVAAMFGSDAGVLAELTAAATTYPPGRVLNYPLLGRGEFFPFWAPDAVAFQVGSAQSDAEALRSILEGVAVVERLAFDRLAAIGAQLPDQLAVLGGATSSALWNRIRSSMQMRALRTVATPQTSLGAAITAFAGAGAGFAEAADRVVRFGPTIEPDPELGARYEDLAHRYRAEFAERGYLPRSLGGVA